MASALRKTAEIGRTHAERRREAETRIVQAAFEIVARRGVDQLTLTEAGEEAGYSRALPTHYFENREALLAAVAEHAVKNYHRACANGTCWRTAASRPSLGSPESPMRSRERLGSGNGSTIFFVMPFTIST